MKERRRTTTEKKHKTSGLPANAEGHEDEAIERDEDEGTEDAAGRSDATAWAEAAKASSGEPSEPGPAAAPAETAAEIARVLAALRGADTATADTLHEAVNADGGEHLPKGRVEAVLGALVKLGLATLDGETWTALAPGKIAQRRAALLHEAALAGLTKQSIHARPTEAADAAALARAGLAKFDPIDGDPDSAGLLSVARDDAASILRRGAIAACIETMPLCREDGAATLVPATSLREPMDVPAELAKERAARETETARAEHLSRRCAEYQKAHDGARASLDRLRAWFRENNLAWPLDKAEKPKPPRDEFTFPVEINDPTRGRMYRIRKILARRLDEVNAEKVVAIARHKERSELLTGRIKTLDDATESFFYDAPAFRRVDVEKGVVQIVHVEDESWTLSETPIRSEEIASAATEAEPAAEVATPAEPTAAVEPAVEAAPELSPEPPKVAGGAMPAPSKEAAPPAPAPAPAPAREPRAAEPINPTSIRPVLVAFVGELLPDELAPLDRAVLHVAEHWGVDASPAISQMVKASARKAHAASAIHHECRDGGEWIGRTRTKESVAEGKALDEAMEHLRAAGREGLSEAQLEAQGVTEATLTTLRATSRVTTNNKRGANKRIVAAELAGNEAEA